MCTTWLQQVVLNEGREKNFIATVKDVIFKHKAKRQSEKKKDAYTQAHIQVIHNRCQRKGRVTHSRTMSALVPAVLEGKAKHNPFLVTGTLRQRRSKSFTGKDINWTGRINLYGAEA